MDKKLKILVSCYACSPNRGSEPGMGWSFVLGLSKFHEVHVICEKKKWQKDIEVYLKQHKNENLKFYFIHKTRAKLLRKLWPPSYYWFYKHWQMKAYNLANKLNEKENFDLIHQLNMVGYREPGFLWKIDKPFVWGPIGGTENVPWSLFSLFNFYGKLFYGFRNVINSYQRKHIKRLKLAANKSNSTLIAATPDIKKSIKKYWNSESEIITEVGIINFDEIKVNKRAENKPLKIVWSGQHTQGKALQILLRTLAMLDQEINFELHILGDGKETNKWKKMSIKLGISNRCKWYGWMEKKDAIQVMKEAHILAITSLKDLTSTITLESISMGLPIVCLDHCGFAFVVDETCGIKISISDPSNIYIDLKNAILTIYNDENYRQKLAMGALKRARNFTWESKVDKLNTIYKKLVS